MSALSRYSPHYTVAEYKNWDGDWELWAGVPIAMTPSPLGTHQRTARNLVLELSKALGAADCDAEVFYELDWIVADDTVVRPDVLVVCGDGPEEYLTAPPALVAEVLSESTEERDRVYKRALYREQGVEAYLLIAPETKVLEIDRIDENGDWQTETVADQVILNLCGDCEITIDRQSLFGTG